MFTPGGFHKSNAVRERVWKTESGRAEFIVPPTLNATGFADDVNVMRLITLRSNDQFNTTIYGYDDRFRGVKGTRTIVFMNGADMARLKLAEGDKVTLETVANDGVARSVAGLKVVRYDVPVGCLGAYYPECNPLIPIWHHAEGSGVPAAKSVPVRVVA